MIEYTATQECWYCATNNVDIYHYGHLNVDESLTTGQPYLEIFNTESELMEFVPDEFKREEE